LGFEGKESSHNPAVMRKVLLFCGLRETLAAVIAAALQLLTAKIAKKGRKVRKEQPCVLKVQISRPQNWTESAWVQVRYFGQSGRAAPFRQIISHL
jgi:hypothetical protein